MKALVLAGGSGSRLWPITHTFAKQLVPAAGKPILQYALEAISGAGIHEVGIVVGDTAREIQEAVGDGSLFGLKATYILQEEPLGLAHAVLISRDFLAEDDFMMYLGDNFLHEGVADLARRFRRERPAAQVTLARVPDPRQFGVAWLDGTGRVAGLAEKPRRPRSDLAVVGVYLFTPAVHAVVERLRPSGRGELEITDAIQALIDEGHHVRPQIITGYWRDTGNVADMLDVNRMVLETIRPRRAGEIAADCEIVGRVAVEDGVRISGSRIVGPAVIGAGATIRDSYVGPFTSIDRDCLIADSGIEYSIVLPGARIEGARRIECSLIGREANIEPAPVTSRAHRLVIGDHSSVQLSG